MITNAQNPRWTDTAHTTIELLVTHGKYGEIPFSASPDDSEPHGRDLFASAVAGEFGPIAEYVAPTVTPAQLAAKRRAEITTRLAAIDRETIPFLRKKAVGKSKTEDDTKLGTLDTEADTLRIELSALS